MTTPVSPEQAAAAAAAQVSQVAADLGPGPQAAPADLGAAAVAAGAAPAEVDADALLRQIQAMQNRLDALEAEKRASTSPDVVRYAQATADHVGAKVNAHPHLNAGDNPIGAGADLAGKVLEAAKAEAEGQTGELAAPLADLTTWVDKHARQFPHIDWNYVLELAGETAAAAAKLAA